MGSLSYACQLEARVLRVRRPLAGVIGAYLLRGDRRRARGTSWGDAMAMRKATNMPTERFVDLNGASDIMSGLLLLLHARWSRDATEHGGVSAGAYNGYRDLWDMWV